MTGAPQASPPFDPWTWLLGRSAAGGWRHAPFRAQDPGQGMDPSLEPRVEVIRRLIAYPARTFAALVEAIAIADRDPRHPIQWVCHRSPGEAPARPYWLTFLRAREKQGRRFYVALELFDRERVGLWFFSGYRDEAVPRAAKAPFPDKPQVSLPRFEVLDDSLATRPFARWVQLAFHDALLSFEAAEDQATASEIPHAPGGSDPLQAPMPSPSQGERGGLADQSLVIDSAAAQAGLAADRAARPGAHARAQAEAFPPTFVVNPHQNTGSLPTLDPGEIAAVDVRSARARLVVAIPGRVAQIVPLVRLVTVIGRDPRCDLVVDDRSVSNEHLRIVYRDGTPTIEDLGSKNGTFVGNVRVTKGEPPTVLPDECFLGVGKAACFFVRDSEDTLLPGEKRPERHRTRLEELVARGRVPRPVVDRAVAEARVRGITPAEVLILQGTLTPEQWTDARPSSSGGGCVVLFFLIAVLGALAGSLTGCHSMAIPPFYEQSIDEHVPMREDQREVTWDEDIGLRPIFQVRTGGREGEGSPDAASNRDRTEVEWLFPLGQYERKGEDKRVRFYPFYLHDVRVDPDGFKHDTTVMFPPGLFTGSDPVKGDFVYVFPFGGTMYGLFGKDEIVGVLFPLYAWTKDRGVEQNHVLFPLVSWWHGGDEKASESGFRVLPFYGHQEKIAKNEDGTDGVQIYDRHTVLWPFVTWVHEAKNSRNPYDSLFIFPFWGKTRSDWRDEDTVLWPFFRYMHDKQSKYEEWRAPFPFFFYGHDDGSEGAERNTRFDVWPLFGFRHRGDSYERHFFLWPFERYERQETEQYTDTRFWFVPFIYTMSRVGKPEPKSDLPGLDTVAATASEDTAPWTERKTRLWPLLKYHRKRNGDVELHALEIMLWDDPMLNFDTILDPLYRIFRYVSRSDGSGELDVLLGAFSTRTKADGSSRWDVFGGLFGHATDKAGEGKTRLFWFLDIEMSALERIDRLGTMAINFASFFQDISVLLYGAGKSVFLARSRGARVVYDILLAQIRFTGAQGVSLSAFAALAVGTLILIEAITFIPSTDVVPHLVALIIIKDVAPLLTAIIIIGRSGTAIAVELANMKLNGEIDALVSMGLPLEHVVVFPRIVGAVVSFAGMVVSSSAAGLVGGFLVAKVVLHVPFTLVTLVESVRFWDASVGMLKAILMGAAIPLICIREGFSVTVSAREVPQAATRAVVRSMTFCMVLNSFLSIYT